MRFLVAVFAMLVASPAVAQPAWPAELPPRPLAARQVNFPPYEIRTLPNGLQVVAVLHHEQPVVSMRMIVRAGSALDPQNKLGLAQLTAALLDQGTATQSANELNESVDFIGGAMGAGAGPDLSFVNVIVMKDSFDVGLRLLSDLARRPAFAQEEIERQRQQTLSSLQVSFEDPEYLADAVFNRLVYGFHPYGMPDSGTPETLAAITRNDLVDFHRRYFVPNNAILAIVGDVTAEEAFAGVAKVFGDWERREIPAQKITPPPAPTRRIVVVNKKDAVQTEVRVGHLGVRRNHPDYMPINLAIRILGGEGANRLHQVLRTERGLTYGAQAEMDTFMESGDFEAETSTRTDQTGEVLRLVLDQFWRLQRDRVGERELADAKAYMTGSFPLTIETPDAIATQVLNVLFYGLPVEQLQSFRERANAVTVADVERVSRMYLQPDRVSIVLVGNAAQFIPQLTKLGLTNFEVVDVEDLDLTAADFKTKSRPPARAGAGELPPTTIGARASALAYQSRGAGAAAPPAGREAQSGQELTSRALLERVIAAKGGLQVLRGVKRIHAVTRAEQVGAEVTTWLEYPNKVRVETRLNGMERIEIFDGKKGWVRDERGVHDVPQEAIRNLELTFKRDTIAMLLAAYDGAMTARRLPDVKEEETLFYALEMSSPSLEPTVLYVDRTTGLIAKQAYLAGGRGSPLIEELFSDYKPVNGLSVAFTARVRSGGQQVYERRIGQIDVNSTFDAKAFTRPAS